jgi:hypothetical protein
MKIKIAYKILLENGELLEMYPELSGSWVKDKTKFTALWKQNLEAIKDIDKDFDEDE